MNFWFRGSAADGCPGRCSGLPVRLLLLAMLAVSGWPVLASEVGANPNTAEVQPAHESSQGQAESHDSQQTAKPEAPSAKPTLCATLGAAALANELPVDFFTRLIWQESRFKVDAISAKGAQGIAQFMPATARSSGLNNPFNPLEAITKSGRLLGDLRREFGNLGLAAAAYNAGPGRVHDWLGHRRPLPRETRAYVRIVTGRSVDEWAGATPAKPVEMPAIEIIPCVQLTALVPSKGEIPAKGEPSQGKTETVKPWGVEIVGGPTAEKALARYREWEPKYSSLVAGREPHVVIRGTIGWMGAVRVRLGEDTRSGADRLCASLKAAGTYCDVMRN
jgi:hypothetical protein